jgi:hypothetical protein
MNLPADAVVILGTKRYEGPKGDSKKGAWREVGPEEILNAAGRAGRAGRAAAGLSFIVPESITTVDRKGEGNAAWHHLQKAILSKQDQCLTVQDPVDALLDRLQVRHGLDSRDVRYFLNRLPLAAGDDQPSEGSIRLLKRSLLNYRYSVSKRGEKFEELLSSVPRAQRKLNRLLEHRPDLAWLDATAWRLGVPLVYVRSLHHTLMQSALGDDASVMDWLRWLFDWLVSNSTSTIDLFRRASLKAAMTPEEFRAWDVLKSRQLSSIFPVIERRVRAWMSGATLIEIERMLSEMASRMGSRVRQGAAQCENARKFVLRFMVDLSYAAGAVALVRRQQLATNDNSLTFTDARQPPLALSVLASCIREGADSPGVLAVRHILGPSVSRPQVQERFAAIQGKMLPIEPNWTYPDFKNHIAGLLSTHAGA